MKHRTQDRLQIPALSIFALWLALFLAAMFLLTVSAQ